MELTPIHVNQFKVKIYTSDELTDSEGNTKKTDVITNSTEYRDELIARYQQQLDTIFEREIDFHKDYNAVKQLVKLQGKYVYSDSDVFFEKLEVKMKTMLADKYNTIRQENTESIYPVVKFFRDTRVEIKPYENVFYLKYHGMTKIKRLKFSQQLSKCDETDRFPILDSLGYAATEIFLMFCYLFGKYLRFDSDRIGGSSKYSDLINRTYLKVQEGLIRATESSSGSEYVDTFVKNLTELYEIGSEVGKIDQSVDMESFLEQCYIKGCKKVVENICCKVNDEDTIFFDELDERMKMCEEINERLKAEGIPLIEVERIAVFASSKHKMMNRTLQNLIFNSYEMQDATPLFKVVELCSRKDVNISLDWIKVKNDSYEELLRSVNIPNEGKLKEMVRYFDGIYEVLKKLKIFEQIPAMSLKNIGDTFRRLWDSIFERDISNHLAFYDDFKLKNMVKLKDRNKFEYELSKVIELTKLLLQLLSRNEMIKFRRKYLSLYVQRILNSFFEDDFALYTNICDCECEVARCLDVMYVKHAVGEVDFVRIHEDMVVAHDIYERIRPQIFVNVIGMKQIEDIGTVNEEEDCDCRLEEDMIITMKEYKRILKKELRNLKVITSNTKVKLELSFKYSKFELDYGGVIIKCNLYQCLILRMFNYFDEIGVEKIISELRFSRKSVERELGCLSNVKTPILIKGKIGWKVNEEFLNDENRKVIIIK